MATVEEKLAALVSLALRSTSEDEARSAAIAALRLAEKHGLVIVAAPSVRTGRGWDAAMRDEEAKAGKAYPRASPPRAAPPRPGRAESQPQPRRPPAPGTGGARRAGTGTPDGRPFDPTDPQWHVRGKYRVRVA